ncbi:hypothetical protein [Microvirus mar9]|uniref:Uncharacterized protein n=1 Tax=Microvirus mar9 TaxID=2851205 RepID=A0A8F5RBY3_9VIRU|nr:hypothetical protein [Microvirus mar9]
MTFVTFFELYFPYIVAAIMFVLAVVGFIVTLITKRSVSSATKTFKEIINMSDLPKDLASKRVKLSQSFSEIVPDYVLHDTTNELERSPIDKNIQNYIDSFIETALERALQKFTVPNAVEDDTVVDYTQSVDDLASLAEAMEIAENYREKLGLSDTASIADIYSAVDKESVKLKSQLNNYKERVENEKKNKTEQKSE